MAVQIRKAGKVWVLEASGTLTIGKGDLELREAFKGALADGARRFVFDLTRVRYMDSSGIGETVACAKRAGEAGAVIKVVVPEGGRIRDLFRITSLDRVFEMFADDREAIASFIG